MKRTIFTSVLLLAIVLVSFAQKKGKYNFLKFKIERNWGIENGDDCFWIYTKEHSDAYPITVFCSQTTNLRASIDEYFKYNDSTISKVKINNYEYSKYTGKTNTDYWNLKGDFELYIYNKENVYIAVIIFIDYIDNDVFMEFMNSIEIDKKATEWVTRENDLFSISLPDLVYDIENNENELTYFKYQIDDTDGSLEIFESIQEDSNTGYIPNTNSFTFTKQINGRYFTIIYESTGFFNKEFYDKIKKGFKPKNNQPKGNVIDASKTIPPSYYKYSGPEWDWLFVAKKNSLSMWDLIHKDIVVLKGIKGNPTCITIQDNEYYYISDDLGNIYMYINSEIFNNKKYKPEKNIKLKSHKARINQIAYIYGPGIISCSDDSTLIIHDSSIDEPNPPITCIGHTDAVTCFDGISNYIVSGSKDNSIIVWNNEGKIISTHNFHSDDITSISIIDNLTVASASKDNIIKIYNFTSGEIIKSIELSNGYVTCFNDKMDNIARNIFKDYFAMGISNGEIIVINKNSYKRSYSFKDDKAIKLVRFYKNGLMTVNIDNKVKFWPIDIPEE